MKLSPESIQETTESNHFKIYKRYPVTLKRGRGSRVWDTEGREYIDALAGIAVNSVGHCHPDVVRAIQEQASELIHISNLYYSEPQARLVDQLTEVSGLDRVFLANSGAEANEAAIKLARKWGTVKGKRGPIIAMENCFHGRTIGTIALGKEKYRKGFGPMPGGIERVPFNDPDAIEEKMNDDTVAVVIEPVQGEGGVHLADSEWLLKVRSLCDKHDALLIYDEIQCGMGRTGKMFAWMHSGARPDVLSTAKALGGGAPIGATLATDEAASVLDFGEHGTTFGGNPLASAAASASLDVIRKEKLVEAAEEKGRYIVEQLTERSHGMDVVREIRGIGLMIGMELNFKCANVVTRMLEKGVLGNCASESTIRLLPPLTISREEIDRVIDVIFESIQEIISENK